ncbi:MAG TPA: glycosyltransferase [Thermoanaerobaculia bacterium]|nr:glycosyltransferase [Thermoanaerobaculia bacterium]
MSKQTICLNMIVKNEAPVIRRCLGSLRRLIDCWVIVDTGSTDGTQEVIREALAGLPGELHERPWVDFAHNRTEALDLARGRADYLLLIDADEALHIEDGFVLPPLTADIYSVAVRFGGVTYTRRHLLRDGKPWRYEGSVHEYVTSPEPYTEAGLPGVTILPHHDGARARDPLTYRRDALLLEQALLADPDNARYVFYLAQSYRDSQDFELALRHYQKRLGMKGWEEEVWYSLYQIAQLKERTQKPWPEVMQAYLAAFQFRSDRAGPLYRIALHYQATREYHISHLFLSRAMAIPEPAVNRLFVERALYEYQVAIEYAVAAHYTGDYKAAIATANAVLRGGRLPAHVVDQIISNRRFSVDALTPKSDAAAADVRLRIVVVFCNPGPELDDCVDSLLQQDFTEWEALFIDDGSSIDQRARLPLDDRRITFARHETQAGTATRLAEYAEQLRGSDAEAVILPLSPSDRLAGREGLARIQAPFADPGCLLAYGQFRTASGQLGDAEPAAGDEDFRVRGARLASHSVVACRARAWRESVDDLWQQAGFHATRFLDDAITVHGAEQQRRVASVSVAPATPKISCLMVTLDRLSLAKRAIQSYAAQSWQNRELVIVTDGAPRFRDALERYVSTEGIDGVRFVYTEAGQPLGALRNLSLTEARGDVVCQWDDDDCSHPDRLRVQCEHMLAQNARASFMTDHLHLLAEQRILCWVDWTLGNTEGTARLFPGTLMMFNDARFRYPEEGPFARQGEDSVLLEKIHAAVPVAPLSGVGHLYLYQYHGKNTFSREHHLRLASFRMPSPFVQSKAEVLREAVGHYPMARPVVIMGREGRVFAMS